MDSVTAALIVTIIEMIAKYGVPGALDVITNWKVENPTLEDIQALKLRVPHPGTYFEDVPEPDE